VSKTKHTPGKWELHLPAKDAVDDSWWEVEGKGGEHIAQNNFGGNERETELANARLIAKAPELLKALEQALKDICEYCPADMTKKEKKACNLCTRIVRWKQLIAEAKGEIQ